MTSGTKERYLAIDATVEAELRKLVEKAIKKARQGYTDRLPDDVYQATLRFGLLGYSFHTLEELKDPSEFQKMVAAVSCYAAGYEAGKSAS